MDSVKVKICGTTNVEDAREACRSGADLLGFVFVPDTPRFMDAPSVKEIVDVINKEYPDVVKVGLFMDQEVKKVVEVMRGAGLDHVQLHGLESPAYCAEIKASVDVGIIKAFKVKDHMLSNGSYMPEDYDEADFFVFDTFHPKLPGGTGMGYDWDVIVRIKDRIPKPFLIAGGLVPENVEAAVKTVEPYGVDVSSGVELSPGKKDLQKLKEFIKNAKKI